MGKGGPGRIRGPTIDEKTKVRISKTLQRNLQRQQAYGGATTVKRQVAGTASSVAFTPLQVIRLSYISFINICYHVMLFFTGSRNRQSSGCRKESQRGEYSILFEHWNFFQCQCDTVTWKQFEAVRLQYDLTCLVFLT